MIILLEELVRIIILIAMLQIIHVLDDNKNKISILSILSIIINFIISFFNLANNIAGVIFYYVINIGLIMLMCKKLSNGLFHGICYYIVEPLVAILILYLNTCLNMQFSSLSSYIVALLCAGILSAVHYFQLVRFRGNVVKLLVINGLMLIVAVYSNYCLSNNYNLLNNWYFIGVIIIVIWICSNWFLCRK
ncbi:hypothetical protein [uncultured Thomasclavelia sp.]|uniref:hypothetical protein n=1 Tax=uncultured Thomasclavelia sp. TaxID=3025759 RepID=UPI0025ED8799|nr:hypothetical protein [uncultured Thomasclavelia sp.]